jgi:hypothetical protein
MEIYDLLDKNGFVRWKETEEFKHFIKSMKPFEKTKIRK